MTPGSCKAKGRRLAVELRAVILAAFRDLEPDDVRVTSGGANGPDLLLSPAAQRCLPLAIETKCTERLNIWEAIEQAAGHAAES
jgi:hypothetical protein